jgi:hypothetical protein
MIKLGNQLTKNKIDMRFFKEKWNPANFKFENEYEELWKV